MDATGNAFRSAKPGLLSRRNRMSCWPWMKRWSDSARSIRSKRNVKLRYFCGLSEQEAADALSISRATASRYWTYARAWLINAIDGGNE